MWSIRSALSPTIERISAAISRNSAGQAGEYGTIANDDPVMAALLAGKYEHATKWRPAFETGRRKLRMRHTSAGRRCHDHVPMSWLERYLTCSAVRVSMPTPM